MDAKQEQLSVFVCTDSSKTSFTTTQLVNLLSKYGKIKKFSQSRSKFDIKAVVTYHSDGDVQNTLNNSLALAELGITVKSIVENAINKEKSESNKKKKQKIDSNSDRSPRKHHSEELTTCWRCKRCESPACTNDICYTGNWIDTQRFEEHVQSDKEIDANEAKVEMCRNVLDNILVPDMRTDVMLSTKNSVSSSENQKSPIVFSIKDEESLGINKFPNGSKVFITFVQHGQCIFVRSAHPESNKKYIGLLKAVNNSAVKAKPILSMPPIGKMILAPYYGAYYRANVLQTNVSKGNVMVDFIDFGNIETVKLDVVRHLLKDFQDMETEIVRVSLKDILHSNAKAKDYLNALLSKNTKLILKYDAETNDSEANIIDCEIFDASTGDSVNILFSNKKAVPNLLAVPEVVDEERDDTSSLKEEIEYILFRGKNVNMFTLDNSQIRYGFISCILEKDKNQFAENDKFVDAVGKSMTSTPFAAELDQICLVKSHLNDCWYRAMMTEFTIGKDPQVILIDYGYIMAVKKQNIRRIPAELLFPCITVQCFIEGLPRIEDTTTTPIDSATANQLKHIFPSGEKIKFKKIFENIDRKYCIAKWF